MGMMSARHFDTAVGHLGHVLAIEAVVAREGIRQRGLEAGAGAERASQLLATVVPPVTEDRAFHEDFDAARALVLSGDLLAAADGVA